MQGTTTHEEFSQISPTNIACTRRDNNLIMFTLLQCMYFVH